MKVLLVDEHPLVLAALRTAIARAGIEVALLTMPTAAAARALLRRQSDVDLVLLDQFLPDGDGMEVLLEFRRTWAGVPVVMVSTSDSVTDVVRAVDGGAMGFVPKNSSYAELQNAMAMIMQGSMYVPRHMLASFGEHLRAQAAARLEAEGPPPPDQDVDDDVPGDTEPSVFNPMPQHAAAAGRRGLSNSGPGGPDSHKRPPTLDEVSLTPRQTEVLTLLLQGLPNKLIARKLNLSVETVKDHVAAVLRALGVSTRTQAVLAVGQMTQVRGSMRPS